MEWSKWAELEPKSKEEVIAKIENDGYTYPHFDKARRGVRFAICTEAIQKDCKALSIAFDDVYPLQTKLF